MLSAGSIVVVLVIMVMMMPKAPFYDFVYNIFNHISIAGHTSSLNCSNET